MSGHSHWHSIRGQKAITDAKRGKVFSKLARILTLTAKETGGDPGKSPKLRVAIEKAKEANMPKENVERAIKKGTGELEGESLEEFIFEGYGPAGTAVIIEGITDNKNRALGDIKNILADNHGKMVGEGAIRWMFERKGIIIIPAEGKNKESLELIAIEAGADDLNISDNVLEVFTKPENLDSVKKALEAKQIKIESANIGWSAKEKTTISDTDKAKCEKLFEELDENDAVQEIYSNF